jgi:hypothetical protein
MLDQLKPTLVGILHILIFSETMLDKLKPSLVGIFIGLILGSDYINKIACIMVSVLISSAVIRGFETVTRWIFTKATQ